MAANIPSSDDSSLLPMSDINVTPLVDVMLVLLVIFMLTSPMLLAGVNIDLPETAAAPLKKQQNPLSITIDKSGLVYLQEKKVSLEDLANKLTTLKKNNKNPVIMIRGDKKIGYGKVMDVIGIVNKTGHNNISLISDAAS